MGGRKCGAGDTGGKMTVWNRRQEAGVEACTLGGASPVSAGCILIVTLSLTHIRTPGLGDTLNLRVRCLVAFVSRPTTDLLPDWNLLFTL